VNRLVLSVAALLVLASPVPAEEGAEGENAGKPRPNIVLILADDLGYADLGVQGCRDIATPSIDSIAKGGIRFTDGYVTSAVCAPTRAGLLTGRYQQRFGFENNPGSRPNTSAGFGLPRSEPILAERLKAAGYATGMVGKWHLGYRRELQPPSRGFDFFFGFLAGGNYYFRARDPILRGFEEVEEKWYLTDAFGREAETFIDANHDRPFFLYVSFNAVHDPLQATEESQARFPEIEDRKRLLYAGMLASMDDAVGEILAALKRHDIERRTLVVFLSDNGGPTERTTSRNDPFRGGKAELLEGGIRIPFMIRWADRLPSGKVERRPVSSLDLVPTILAAAGVKVKGGPPLDGVDLLPYLTGVREGRPHEALFWRRGKMSAVRMGDLKLIRHGRRTWLFDLAKDPGETNNLAKSRPEDLERLHAAYEKWSEGTIPALWTANDGKPRKR